MAGSPKSSPSPRGERFTELDGLRGMAALMVVVFHYTGLYDRLFHPKTKFPFHFDVGYLGVQLFFLISGFVIFLTTTRYKSVGVFSRARLTRLYPTYWVCLIITVAVSSLLPIITQPVKTIVMNFTMLQTFLRVRDVDGAYWSLSRELVFYAAVAILLVACKGDISTRVTTYFTIIWSTLGALLCLLQYIHPNTLLSMGIKASAAEYASYFSMGMLLFQTRRGERKLSWEFFYLWVIAVVTHYLIDSKDPSTSFTILASTLVIALLIVPVFALVALRPATPILRTRVLVWLGGISYPMYLLHQNVGYVVIHRSMPTLGLWGSRLLALCIVLVLAWAVHVTIEQRLTARLSKLWVGSRRTPSAQKEQA